MDEKRYRSPTLAEIEAHTVEFFLPVEEQPPPATDPHGDAPDDYDGVGIFDSRYSQIKGEASDELEELIAGLVPGNVVGVLVGSGGAGKGIIAQSLCSCVAAQKPFLGRAVLERRPAIFWTAEDRKRQLLHRQRRINKQFNISDEEIDDTLVLKSHRKENCVLWLNGRPTKLLLGLLGDAKSIDAGLLVIDSASITYGDREIERFPVATFMRWLDLKAEEIGCTIIVILHTSRSSDDSVERLSSGSTAWVFQARFALLLKKGRDDRDDDDELSITVSKINYGKPGLKIDLEWTKEGVVTHQPPRDTVDNIQAASNERKLLEEVARCWSAGWPLSMSANAKGRYLPLVMKQRHKMKPGVAEQLATSMLTAGTLVPARKTTGAKLSGIARAQDVVD